MGFFDFFKRKRNGVARVVQKEVRRAIKQQNTKQTKMKWEEQFMWYQSPLRRTEYQNRHVMKLLTTLRDVNPDASMALWNVLRLGNSGHKLEVFNQSGTNNPQAEIILNDLAKRVGKLYGGGTDQLVNVLLLTGFTQGAIALEVEVSEDGRDIVDFHAVDPSTLDFMPNKETHELDLVQLQSNGKYKVMNRETVFYLPLDPDIADPYGRSPILPTLQIVFFQIEVMKDLKKVLHHQGHERFDIKVLEKTIIENIPESIKYDEQKTKDFVQSYVQDIMQAMMDLEPDSDFYHTDAVEITMTGGAGGKAMDARAIIQIINQQMTSALKQLPILMGQNESTTETHGTVQFQIYVSGIESIQRIIKRLLERAYNVALQVYGIQGSTKITFNSIQAHDRLKEAQAEQTEIENAIKKREQGWIDNNEASNAIVGHDAISAPVNNSPLLAALSPRMDKRMYADPKSQELMKQKKKMSSSAE